MCRRITCNTCGKPSFTGCGRHVETVLANVPPAERCQCRAAVPPGSPKDPQPAAGGQSKSTSTS